ncbi:hypothetical protein EIP91_011859 [Steccherinum ochraceum]|uniref:Vacuolar sorting protein Vps3844 C-terminal domain-containing protein n=1 Tax=Steccherinum ochraceum TaxID=92696 RepID=A0A4R0RL39_9APHY|nr:hypothetical protein EIP91_011859 [Steccherinum ochraceum]
MRSTSSLLLPIAIGFLSSVYAVPDTRVFLHPSPLRTTNNDLVVTPEDASRAVAQFAGLDVFEPMEITREGETEMYATYDAEEVRMGSGGVRKPVFELVDEEVGPFVGKGMGRTLVIGVDGEGNLEDILPHTLFMAFSANSSPSSFSWSSLSLSNLVERATQLYDLVWSSPRLPQAIPEPKANRYLDIFDLPSTGASEAFLNDLGALVDFVDWADFAVADTSAFGSFDLSSFKTIGIEYGRDSAQYRAAASAIRAAISSAMTQTDLKIVVVAAPMQAFMAAHSKRQQPPSQSPLPVPSPPPQHPISAVSTCYTTLDACTNSTDSCSNHGQCVSASKAGKTCFVCSCTATKSINGNGKTKTTLWAGEQCEKVDVSQEFVLLVGTVVVIIALVVGSISLLSSIGDEKLPQVLAEGIVPSKRD